MNMERTADDFFGQEYLDYARYTIENRAIPSMVDGFKPSQRKIAYAANKLWSGGNTKAMKVFQLGGQAAAMAFYHHGSLDDTIIGMTQDFKNSMPIFEGVGQFGSLRAPDAGAPRYVGVRFSKNFRLLYKDFNLLTSQQEEGEEIEPLFFLPIIPTVLLNGGAGIAVGFSTKILNRHPHDLIDACEEVLRKGTCTQPLLPYYKGFLGPINAVGDSGKTWAFHGVYDVKNTSTLIITEVPPGYTYEKYEVVLDRLVEDKVIRGYDDASSDQVHYTLKFERKVLADLQKKDLLDKTLKMREQATENIVVLDHARNLQEYSTAQDLVLDFVEFRMGYYVRRKAAMMRSLKRELLILTFKAQFVKAVVDGTLKVANVAKADIQARLKELRIKTLKQSYDYLLSMPIYSLTMERYQKLLKERQAKQAELEKVMGTEPKDMYLGDLAALRKALPARNKG